MTLDFNKINNRFSINTHLEDISAISEPKKKTGIPKEIKKIGKIAFEGIKLVSGIFTALIPPCWLVLKLVKERSLNIFKAAREELSSSSLQSLKKALKEANIPGLEASLSYSEVVQEDLLCATRNDLLKAKNLTADFQKLKLKSIDRHVSSSFPEGIENYQQLLSFLALLLSNGKLCSLDEAKKKIRAYLPNTWDENQLESFAKLFIVEQQAWQITHDVETIIDLLRNESKQPASEQLLKVRRALNQAIKSDAYQVLKNNIQNPCTYFLQIMAYTITTQGSGTETARKLGEKALKGQTLGEDTNWGDLAKLLKKSVRNTCTFNRNTKANSLFYVLAFPMKIAHELKGRFFPSEYNSYEHWNMNFKMGDFMFGSQKIGTFFGPGPGTRSDEVVQAEMDLLDHVSKPILRTQVTLESPQKQHEQVRRNEILQFDKRNKVWTAAGHLDGKIYKGKKEFKEIQSTRDFIEKVRQASDDHFNRNAVFDAGSKEKSISKEEVTRGEDAFTAALSQFESSDHWKKLKSKKEKGNARLSKALSLGLQSFLNMRILSNMYRKLTSNKSQVLKELDQELDRLKVESNFCVACKQNIDRGLIMNILLRLYVEALSGQPLTPEKVHEIVGYTLLRAGIVDGRALIRNRLEALYDFLSLIGNNQKILIDSLRTYLASEEQGKNDDTMMNPGFYKFEPAEVAVVDVQN